MVIQFANRQFIGPAITGCLMCASLFVDAQDLAQVGKEGGFQVSGGLNAYSAFYTTDLGEPRQVPLTWGLTARLEFRIYDLQIPFSLTISERQRSFRQPFNQYGVSPRYKWVRAHIGYRTMHLSDLTMSGQNFLGAGLELTPGKLRFGVMYGRLRKEVFADTTNTVPAEPAFERWCAAGKLGFGSEGSHVDLVLLRAWDRYDAIALAKGAYGNAQPEENAVLGIDLAQALGKRVRLQVDAAFSLDNVGAVPDERTTSQADISRKYDSFLFNVDPTTRIGTAIKAGLGYSIRGISLAANYERIDPLFRTLGCYYFSNDVENIRGTVGFGFFKQKFRVQGSLGRQRNDLKHIAVQRVYRTIGSAGIAYNSGRSYSGSIDFSNFQADIRTVFAAAESDTLNVVQVSRSLNFNNTVRIDRRAQHITHSIDGSAGLQEFDDGAGKEGSGSSTLNIGAGYRYKKSDRYLTLGARFTASRFSSGDAQRDKLGGSLNVRKGFLQDKLGVDLRMGIYNNRAPDGTHGLSQTTGLGANLKIGHTHALGFMLNYNSRSALGPSTPAQYQLRGQVNYSMNINSTSRKKSADKQP